MTRVIVDETLRSKLNGLDKHVELCDDSGRTMGHFLPDALYKRLLNASDQCPYTDEEISRHMQEPGGRPLAEIWQRLGRA